MTRVIELRSDTFTRPTEVMRRAMYEAEVGDDVWEEDPTVQRLEARAAEIMGKEAALFVSSGTQGNLLGVLGHTRSGNEVLLGDESHLFNHEAGGAAAFGGLQMRTLPNDTRGRLNPDDVARAIRGEDIHEPPTGLVALENTHNHCGGSALSREEIAAVADVAHRHGVPVHLDGARIFNAAVALGVPAASLAEPVDSVTFCLSKGLGAPVGSILCGSREFIHRARKLRKMLGGGMRQVGVLAAPGLVALEQNVDRLAEDHANARRFAEGLAEIPGIVVSPERVQTNIVYFDVGGVNLEPREFGRRLKERGIHIDAWLPTVRVVTSYEVNAEDIEYTLSAIRDVVGSAVPVTA